MNMDGVWVMMPVRCIGKICKECPNLNIDNNTTSMYADGAYVGNENDLYCRGVKRCSRIKEMVEKDIEKQFDERINKDDKRTTGNP